MDLDRFVAIRMRRVMGGDDEALNALVIELREHALRMIPKDAAQHAPLDVCAQQVNIALHEALLLWSPVRGHFVDMLDWRVRMRLGALFLRIRDLKTEVTNVPGAE
jgi:hypothetical protein